MKTNSLRDSVRFQGSALVVAAILAIPFIGTKASASTIVTDYNFDSVALGQNVPTTYPGVAPLPQQTVYAIGGYPNDGDQLLQGDPGLTGSVTVQNVGTMSHAALMTTTQAGTGALWMDTALLAPARIFDLSFDIDVVTAPTSGLAQSAGGAPNGQAFAINVFGLDSQRLFRFAASPTSATGGNFGLRLPGASGDLLTFGNYTDGDTYHVDMTADFSTDTMNVSLNGVQVVTNADLVNPGHGVSEIFMFQNGVDGVANSVALDNIQSEVSVPDQPATWAILLLGALCLFFYGRACKRQAMP